MSTAELYRTFGEAEARGESPTYERLCAAIAEDGALIGRLDELPRAKRQPNLLLAAVRYLGGPTDDPAAFLDWTGANWPDVAATMLARRTQTNEANRCATLLPVLARLPQPLALLEVGTSAGLCLYPDRYRYSYGGATIGPDSPVRLECAVDDRVPVPDRVPTVAWRAGIDLNPLDAGDPDDLRWLEALVWPEHDHRRARLHAAAGLVAQDPPHIVRGDLLTDLAGLAAQAPAGATLVVFHTAVLSYVDRAGRAAFAEAVSTLPGHWIANEGPGVLSYPEPHADLGPPPGSWFVMALDGVPVAYTKPHGQALRWL